MQCATPYTFGQSVCWSLPNFKTVDEYPIRSPMNMADALLPEIRGKTFVEIGTRNGDIFSCLARFAKRSWAVEMVPEYCASLRAKGFEVACEKLTDESVVRALPEADVYFMWMFHKYNLGLVRLVHKALVARNRTAVMYYGLTGTLGVEIDVLPENLQAIRARKYHQSGTFTRVFFQEPCAKPSATCAAEKPKWYQTAKGPDAHWGVLHLLRIQVGVPAATPAPYAATGINTGTGPCPDGRTIGTSRCMANVTKFVPSAAYPFRSPLVSVDYLIDSLVAAGRGASQTLAILGKSDRDLVGCLAEVSPVRTVHIRSDTASLTRIASAANAWYWHDTVASEYAHGGRGARSSVSASVGLVNMLDRELRRRGERGRVFIGLDGYSHADMLVLPELIRELNGTKYRGSASLTRLPFDESSEFGAESARPGRSTADENYPSPREVLNAKMGSGRLRQWRRWGIWHVLSVQIGGLGKSSA